MKITPREKRRHRVSPFLAWGNFHARSRFARSTIPEEKWGTTRSLYRNVPPQTIRFLRRFALKTGIDFTHFGLGSGMVFEATTEVYEGIYRFNSK